VRVQGRRFGLFGSGCGCRVGGLVGLAGGCQVRVRGRRFGGFGCVSFGCRCRVGGLVGLAAASVLGAGAG
jgi:hypothetical protein